VEVMMPHRDLPGRVAGLAVVAVVRKTQLLHLEGLELRARGRLVVLEETDRGLESLDTHQAVEEAQMPLEEMHRMGPEEMVAMDCNRPLAERRPITLAGVAVICPREQAHPVVV